MGSSSGTTDGGMKLHLIEQHVQKAIRDVEIELSAMDAGQRTRHGESKDHLIAEIRTLRAIASLIEQHNLDEMQKDHRKASLLRERGGPVTLKRQSGEMYLVNGRIV